MKNYSFFKHKPQIENLLSFFEYIFLFLLPWQTIWIYDQTVLAGSKLEYATLGFYATEILLWFILSLFLIYSFHLYKNTPNKAKFSWTKDRQFVASVLIFLIYAFIIGLLAFNSDVAQQQVVRIMASVLLFFLIFIGPVSVYKAVFWFISGAVIQGLFGIWQFIAQSTFSSTFFGLTKHLSSEPGVSVVASDSVGRILRAYGSFQHPNIFGGFLVVAILFTLLLLIKNNEYSFTKKRKVLLNIYLVILTTALFFTFSRSAWLALAVSFYLVIYLIRKKILKNILSLLCLFFVLFIIYFPLVSTRFSNKSFYETKSIEERVGGVNVAFQIIKNNILFGVGPGNYTLELSNIFTDQHGWAYQPVHNFGLLFLAEYGIIGFLLILFMLISFFRVYRINNFIILSIILYSVLGFFDHYLMSTYIGIVLTSVYFSFLFKMHPQFLHK